MDKSIKNIKFEKRKSIEQVEEGKEFAPKFNDEGLIPCITIDSKNKEILMFSYMNKVALKKTLVTNLAHYWSRSRKEIWKKGETSGMFQHVKRIIVDDDQDSILIEVELEAPLLGGEKASCLVGYRSCFYRELKIKDDKVKLTFIEDSKKFDPKTVYAGTPNPTKL